MAHLEVTELKFISSSLSIKHRQNIYIVHMQRHTHKDKTPPY